MNGDVNFLNRKIASKKYHEILFLELVENQSVSTSMFARFEATPNQSIDSWVRSDCSAGLGNHHSVHITKGSVQTALIRSVDGHKVALGSWLEGVCTAGIN